jgi:hypothetical protein
VLKSHSAGRREAGRREGGSRKKRSRKKGGSRKQRTEAEAEARAMAAELPILKPRNDDRQYRRIVLSNGLQALLISDPVTEKVSNNEQFPAPEFLLPWLI